MSNHGYGPFRALSYSRRRTGANSQQPGLMATLFALLTIISTARAVFINFDNCLDLSYKEHTNPQFLQWDPKFFNAHFYENGGNYNLSVITYGNVTGQLFPGPYPPPDDPLWNNTQNPFGKFVNFSTNADGEDTYTTFKSTFNVLSYQPFETNQQFCKNVINATCPVAPRFFANASNPYELAAFGISHNFFSSYAFSTLAVTLRLTSGTSAKTSLACVSATITPDLGSMLSNVLRYVPLAILIVVGAAIIFAAILSPWGTTNLFNWTSNRGRDQDLLRLVTPGFGDCLQYIQFIVLAGSLSLAYPGFFQPVVSKASWSTLMFNESFVSHGDGIHNPVDGIYVTNSTYGLTRMSQLVGMSNQDDIWAGMTIWTLVIMVVLVAVIQAGFLGRWALRSISNTHDGDLRSKNWPFTGGVLVRIVCIYFLLPIVSLSTFQLVIAPDSPAEVVALAVVLLVAILIFACWILRVIFALRARDKTRDILFDDLPTLLLYGPLYNTYAENAAPFALIPALLTFVRGVAIGAVQQSGIAQLVILAICEIIMILTIHAFRPFHTETFMNAYHTFFALMRLVVVLLMVSFVPSLGISESTKGWLGYVILLLHAIVLIFGFFLNAIQTIIEVAARLAGAGGDERSGGVARGGLVRVFGVRQLSRRAKRPAFRHSLTSDAAILTNDADAKSTNGARSRSLSASSAILLNNHVPASARMSGAFEQGSTGDTDGEQSHGNSHYSLFSGAQPAATTLTQKRPDIGVRTTEAGAPFYRPPRQRRATGDLMAPGARSRGSLGSGEWANQEGVDAVEKRDSTGRAMSTTPPRVAPSPAPAYLRHRDDSDPMINDPRRDNVDYAVREVDFYYGVRGPALSSQPGRKLRTGPADPVGPVSSATGWFKGFFGRKTKDKAKGFEVVRSARAPPQEQYRDQDSPEISQEPYRDSPQSATQPEVPLPGQRTRSRSGRDDDITVTGDDGADGTYRASREMDDGDSMRDEEFGGSPNRRSGLSDLAPSLGPIDTGEDIRIPSRWNSRQTNRGPSRTQSNVGGSSRGLDEELPPVPRRSSRRQSSNEPSANNSRTRLPALVDSSDVRQSTGSLQPRIPFSHPYHTADNRISMGAESTYSLDEEPQVHTATLHRTTLSNAESLAPPSINHDRPTSVGYVNRYRASDSINLPTAHAASSAEVVNDLEHSHSRGGSRTSADRDGLDRRPSGR